MALATFIAGPYTATHDGSDTGDVEDGFDLQLGWSYQELTVDRYGDSIIDAIFRGGNCFLHYIGQEATAAQTALNPFAAGLGTLTSVGLLMDGGSLANATVLTKVSGSSAAPASLTASKSWISGNEQFRMKHAARLRQVPVSLRLGPFDNSGTIVFFTTT